MAPFMTTVQEWAKKSTVSKSSWTVHRHSTVVKERLSRPHGCYPGFLFASLQVWGPLCPIPTVYASKHSLIPIFHPEGHQVLNVLQYAKGPQISGTTFNLHLKHAVTSSFDCCSFCVFQFFIMFFTEFFMRLKREISLFIMMSSQNC